MPQPSAVRVAQGAVVTAAFVLATFAASAAATWVKADGSGFDADKQAAYDNAYAQALDLVRNQCDTNFLSNIVVMQSKVEYQSATGLPGWKAVISIRALCHDDV